MPTTPETKHLSFMLARKILRALHLDKSAHGALEFEREPLATVELVRGCGGGNDQVDVAIVEFVHECDEAPRLVVAGCVEYRHAGDDDRLVPARDLDVIVLAARAGADGEEVEPDGAV